MITGPAAIFYSFRDPKKEGLVNGFFFLYEGRWDRGVGRGWATLYIVIETNQPF